MTNHATANTRRVLYIDEPQLQFAQVLRAVENGGGGRPKMVALGW
jgi:hypothetical protein